MTDQHKHFDNLDIPEDILKGIYTYGFNDPSPIQVKGIKAMNTKKDCIIQSQSGTGKTATYLIGVFNNIGDGKCLIVSPTRELARQIYNVATSISKFSKHKVSLLIGGTNLKFEKDTNIFIGTIGRINHVINKKLFSNITLLVMDEADDILSDGVTDEINNIVSSINKNAQKILISATLSQNVFNLSNKVLEEPEKILLKKTEIAVDLISQFYVDVEIEEYKFDVLMDLYNIISTTQAIIFCNTIRKVQWLTEQLEKENFTITSIHGKMTQEERNNIVKDFRDGKTRILLTTDLLARGIDIPQVNLVVNYDLPINKETYIHRIGRCGRFGKKGVSISMVKMNDRDDIKTLNRMKHYYNIDINEFPDNIEQYI